MSVLSGTKLRVILGIFFVIGAMVFGYAYLPELSATGSPPESITSSGGVDESKVWEKYSDHPNPGQWAGFTNTFESTPVVSFGDATETRSRIYTRSVADGFIRHDTNLMGVNQSSTYRIHGEAEMYNGSVSIPVTILSNSSLNHITRETFHMPPNERGGDLVGPGPVPLGNPSSIELQATKTYEQDGVTITRLKPVSVDQTTAYSPSFMDGSAHIAAVTGYVDVANNGDVVNTHLTYWVVSTNGVVKHTFTRETHDTLTIEKPNWSSKAISADVEVVDGNTLKVTNTGSVVIHPGYGFRVRVGMSAIGTGTLSSDVAPGESTYIHVTGVDNAGKTLELTSTDSPTTRDSGAVNLFNKEIHFRLYSTNSQTSLTFITHDVDSNRDS